MNESNINIEEKSIKKETQDDYRVRLYSKRKIKIYDMTTNNDIKDLNIGLRAKIRTNKNGQMLYDEQINVGKEMSSIFQVLSILHILVIALTQSGKTGAMIAFISEYTEKNIIHPENIYILTGLSSTEWKEQTKFRMPDDIKVYHRDDCSKFKEDVKDKENVLIILDEIQIASKEDQQLHQTFKELGFDDPQVLFKKDIKIAEFSATPDGCYYDIEEWKDNSCIIKMEPGKGYTSCFDLLNKGRVVQYKDLADKKQGDENINELRKHIVDKYRTIPRYHIIRTPNGKNQNVVVENIKKVFGEKDYKYKHYDQENKKYEDINDLLKDPPSQHTFIFIKEKCRCAKTLIKKNLGVLYERCSKSKANDSVIIQSLLGRLTGYDDNGDSIVFTNIDSIKKYKALWDSGFKDKTIRWNSNTTKLTKRKVIESKGTVFQNKNIANKTEKTDETQSVPILISVSEQEFHNIKKSGNEWNKKTILEIIKKYSANTFELIKSMKKQQIVKPDSSAYDKLIIPHVEAFENNTKVTWPTSKYKDTDFDSYLIYLDKREYRIIVSIYYGSKRIKS